MPTYNLIEYNNNYSKTSGRLRQYYKDDLNDSIANSESSKYEVSITGKTPKNANNCTIKIIK